MEFPVHMEVSRIIASVGTVRTFKYVRNVSNRQLIFLQCLPGQKLDHAGRATLNIYNHKDGSC